MASPVKDGLGVANYHTNGSTTTLIESPGQGRYIKLWSIHLHTATNTTIYCSLWESNLVDTSSLVAYGAVNNNADTNVHLEQPICLQPDTALVLSGDASWTAHDTIGSFGYTIGFNKDEEFAPSGTVTVASESLESPNSYSLQTPNGYSLEAPNSVPSL